jgi:hypothetical protein
LRSAPRIALTTADASHDAPPQECLISFFSEGFPLAKAEAYVALVKCAYRSFSRSYLPN